MLFASVYVLIVITVIPINKGHVWERQLAKLQCYKPYSKAGLYSAVYLKHLSSNGLFCKPRKICSSIYQLKVHNYLALRIFQTPWKILVKYFHKRLTDT